MAWQVLNHGTSVAYKKGCRCDQCKAYNTWRQRNWRSNGTGWKKPPQEVLVDDKVGNAWRKQAACADHPTDWWFNSNQRDPIYRNAMRICSTCPVKTQCLEWALQWPVHELHGIWGGTSKNERIQIKQRKAPTWHDPTLITIRTTGRLSGTRFSESPEPSTN